MTGRPTMWRALFDSQWKWTRAMALLGVLIGFALPITSVRTAAAATSLSGFIGVMAAWGVGYAIAAAALGLVAAVGAWAPDHRLRHVYALSLPIPRWKYVLYRFTSGAVMLALPMAAVFVGSEVAAHSSLVPAELHSYPISLTLRFAFATLVAYALVFAISAATARTAGYILAVIGLVIVAQVVFAAAGLRTDVLSRAFDVIFSAPGLLAVFGGRWMLIDV